MSSSPPTPPSGLTHRLALLPDACANHTNCVYLATAGQDAGGVSGDYNIFTSRTSTTTVNVVILDGSNNTIDLPFYLAVFC